VDHVFLVFKLLRRCSILRYFDVFLFSWVRMRCFQVFFFFLFPFPASSPPENLSPPLSCPQPSSAPPEIFFIPFAATPPLFNVDPHPWSLATPSPLAFIPRSTLKCYPPFRIKFGSSGPRKPVTKCLKNKPPVLYLNHPCSFSAADPLFL